MNKTDNQKIREAIDKHRENWDHRFCNGWYSESSPLLPTEEKEWKWCQELEDTIRQYLSA